MLFHKIKSIDIKQLETKRQTENILIVDVREKEEYQSGHIPNAINMPLSHIEQVQLDKPAYIICQSGMRSRSATKYLTKKGYDVTNVTGGMHAYTGKVVR